MWQERHAFQSIFSFTKYGKRLRGFPQTISFLFHKLVRVSDKFRIVKRIIIFSSSSRERLITQTSLLF